jgi:biopolymer transport protein ExbD
MIKEIAMFLIGLIIFIIIFALISNRSIKVEVSSDTEEDDKKVDNDEFEKEE